jgi:DNA-directed RNA polymerase subunit H (RpoH/RPB5)
MSEYPAFVVVSTIWNGFFRYRRLSPVPQELRTGASDAAPLLDVKEPTRDNVVDEMDRFDYFRLDAERKEPRGKRSHVVILILAKDGKYARFSPDLKKLLEGVAAEKITREGRLDELIIVAEDEFFNRKLLLETVHTYQEQSLEGPDLTGEAPFYNMYHYHVFSLVVPEHVEVPAHRIMTDDEAEAFYKRERLAPQDLNIIYEMDPPVIWIGGRARQLIEVTRNSETAGKAIAVRRVVKAPIK